MCLKQSFKSCSSSVRYFSGGTKKLSLRIAFVLSFIIIVAVPEKDGFFFWSALCGAARLLCAVGQAAVAGHERAAAALCTSQGEIEL